MTFAADLATAGAIGLQTPDGQEQLNMHLLGLCYLDQASGKSVWVAEVTNSAATLIGPNELWYESAFSGVNGAVSYINTLAGLEQNVVLEAQPAPPEAYGLSSATTVLQAITEFVSPPTPTISTNATSGDETLQFSEIQFTKGSAFMLGSQSNGVAVQKQWVTQNGRWFLVEQVPIAQIAGQLDALPAGQSASIKRRRNSILNVASKKRLWPVGFLTEGNKNNKGRELGMKAGKKPAPLSNAGGIGVPGKPAFVLDYMTLNTSQTNVVFQGDTTYYISGTVNLYGTNTTFEGSTVLKYTNNVGLTVDSPVSWLSSAYRPIIMTAMDDNSVGEKISGSTGNPSGYYATYALDLVLTNIFSGFTLSNFRIAYANTAIQLSFASDLNNLTLINAQILNCNACLSWFYSPGSATIENSLFANDLIAFYTGLLEGNPTILAENVTLASISDLGLTASTIYPPSYAASPYFTNCILASVTARPSTISGGASNGVYQLSWSSSGSWSFPGQITNNQYPFQSVGAGNFYLTNGCTFQNAGTTNIDPALLAALAQKTTYPPILYSNVVFSNNLVLNPQAQRDYDTPDLGFHYDPIDYLVDRFWITNGILTVTNGAVLAGYNDYDLIVNDGSSIISIGTPLAPNWFTRYSCVQEQPLNLGMGTPGPGSAYMVYPDNATNEPAGQFRFTKFSCPAAGGYHLFDDSLNFAFSNLVVQDCEFWGGQNDFSGYTNTFTSLKNSLFVRSPVSTTFGFTNNNFAVSNNLFWNMQFTLWSGANSNTWFFFNNDFDNCAFSGSRNPQLTVNGYNSYLVNTNRLNPTNAFDIVTNSDIAYQAGPLGSFYQPTNSILINQGSTNANLVGLYHYTTTTNQVIEGTNIVSIGYHYVATDTNGVPLDSNGDGIPDYLEDANGNGLVDSGEIGWNIPGDLGLQVLITRPKNNSIIP